MSRAESASWAPGTTRKRLSLTALLMIWRKLVGMGHALSVRGGSASHTCRGAADQLAARGYIAPASRYHFGKISSAFGENLMNAEHHTPPIVHFVGSIPLPDTETVFRTLSSAVGGHVARLPDGETGIRKTWIRFLQDVLAQNPAIEFATDVPPFRFVQWDGKLVREIPRLRIKSGMTPNRKDFKTGYADMAIDSFAVFDRLQKGGVIPQGVKFQISIPTPIAPTYNNMVPGDRPKLLPPLTQHFLGEVDAIA